MRNKEYFEVIKKTIKNGYCYFCVTNNGNYGISRVKIGDRLDKSNINYSFDREKAKKKYHHIKMY